MIKQETIELAAKWWKNKLEHNISNMVKYIEAQKDESMTSAMEYYLFLKDVLSKLDSFEEVFIETMKDYDGDKCALYFSYKGPCTIFAEVLKKVEISMIYVPDITTVIMNDKFMLIRFPFVSYSSMMEITSADELINCGEEWA